MTKEEEIEARKNWRYRWLGLLFEFSHLEFQQGLWIDRKYPNTRGWFTEDICQYFDDLNLDDDYTFQLENNIISKGEFSIIQGFHFELNKFAAMTNALDTEMDEKDILKNKDWIKLCGRGLVAWEELKNEISDLNERNHMIELEDNYLGN